MELVDLNGRTPNGYLPGGICDTLYGDQTDSNTNSQIPRGAQELLQELNGQSAVERTMTNPLNVFGDMPLEVGQSNYEPCDNEGTGDEIEKICAWLAADYKMTEAELNEAEEIIDNYFEKGTTQYELKNCSNGSGRFYVLRAEMSEAELEEYQLMCALENKCSPVASFTCGVFNGIPFFGMGTDYIEKWYLADNWYAEKVSFGTAAENSRTQHPIATQSGAGLMFVATSWDLICALKSFVSKCGTKIANSIARKSVTLVDDVVDDVIVGSANAVDDVLGNGASVIDDAVGGEVNVIDDAAQGGKEVLEEVAEENMDDVAEATLKGGTGVRTNTIPDNDSIAGHIFRDAEGHITDTPENRVLLEDVANNVENFRGTDKYGNEWYTEILEDGREVWVESRNGNIFEGGINETPKSWSSDTGLKKQ